MSGRSRVAQPIVIQPSSSTQAPSGPSARRQGVEGAANTSDERRGARQQIAFDAIAHPRWSNSGESADRNRETLRAAFHESKSWDRPEETIVPPNTPNLPTVPPCLSIAEILETLLFMPESPPQDEDQERDWLINNSALHSPKAGESASDKSEAGSDKSESGSHKSKSPSVKSRTLSIASQSQISIFEMDDA